MSSINVLRIRPDRIRIMGGRHTFDYDGKTPRLDYPVLFFSLSGGGYPYLAVTFKRNGNELEREVHIKATRSVPYEKADFPTDLLLDKAGCEQVLSAVRELYRQITV